MPKSTSNTPKPQLFLFAMSEYPATSKRQKLTQQPLLPGLPDHIAQLCLSYVKHSILYHVCSSWRRLIYSPSFPPFLSLYTLLSSKSDSSIQFFAFDPISSNWDPLPSPPPHPPLHVVLHHPSFLSRKLPVQSVAVSGKLIIVAATTHNFYPALTRPLVFDPIVSKWIFGPPFVTPRRWCAVGALRDVVYVASGIGSQFSSDVAKSVERWNLEDHKPINKGTKKNCDKVCRWEKMRELKDGRFSRDAIDAVGWRGKLCIVNVTAKEGVVYDVVKDDWEDMPEGMIKGWRGPVASMDEKVMYMVDENNGTLRKYDQEIDEWSEEMKSELLKGAQHMAAGGGRVCIVCEGGDGDGDRIVVVNVLSSPPRLWVVDTPPGFEALTVHILPRMSRPVSDFPY